MRATKERKSAKREKREREEAETQTQAGREDMSLVRIVCVVSIAS